MRRCFVIFLAVAVLICCLGGCRTQDSAISELEDTVKTEIPDTDPTEEQAEESAEKEVTEPADTVECDERLLAALNGQLPVVLQDGRKELLADYLKGRYEAEAVRYTLVDFDQDLQNELVVETSSAVASYIVLHYSDPDIFAFPFGGREMINLNTDGSFVGGAGASCTYYLTIRFNGGGYVITEEAVADSMQGVFEICGVECSEEQVRAFEQTWQSREAAVWIPLAAAEEAPTHETVPLLQQTPTPYLQTIGRADQPIYSGPGFDYGFVCTVEIAGVYTIVEEMWDAQGYLWGRLKSGVGWVNLTEIRFADIVVQPLSADFADNQLISSGNYHHCIADTSEYMVQVAFRANEVLYDFCFFSAVFTGDTVEAGEQLYYLMELTPDKPLVADVSFPGDLSMYGIRFTDSSGATHSYTVMTSGRDGSLVLAEETFS